VGWAELGANVFRITQTEMLLEKQDIISEKIVTDTYYNFGVKVRDAMINISGVAPEDLQTPEKSIKQIEKEELKKLKGDTRNNVLFIKIKYCLGI